MNEIKRIALIICGSACVALGIVGMFLPVLPTTPFLLLATVCYARSSQKFYDWLTTNRWCGSYILNYREGRGISLRLKVTTILLLWITISLTAGFAVTLWWGRLILLAVAIGVTFHLLWIKTFNPVPLDPQRPPAEDALAEKTMIG